MDVSKEKFDAVYSKYAPSKFVNFVYTHYNVNLNKKPTPIGTLLAVIGWVVGTLGLVVFDQLGMKEVAKAFLWAYLPFAALLISLPAFILNQRRIKKIAKELGVSLERYNQLVALYYPGD